VTAPALHLASSSPRRRDILTSLGLVFSYGGVDIDESRRPGEALPAMALRLAEEKARAAADVDLPVLAADTIVALGDRAFGKPATREQGLSMLDALSGKSHRVITGVALCSGGRLETAMSDTEVRFRDIRPDEALAYWQSGEPRDKAGAYGIQGLGGVFVESVSGSYSGVVGLPVFETALLLARAGIDVLSKAGRE
jgi:septum formation protein